MLRAVLTLSFSAEDVEEILEALACASERER